MPATYEPIATTTLSSAASTITFSSIPSTYTDLRVILIGQAAADSSVRLQFNSDTASNYSTTYLYGFSGTVYSGRETNNTYIETTIVGFHNQIKFMSADIFSYTGSTNKTVLTTMSGDNNGAGGDIVSRNVGLWRNTSAITAVTLRVSGTNFNTGTTATLYGILKA